MLAVGMNIVRKTRNRTAFETDADPGRTATATPTAGPSSPREVGQLRRMLTDRAESLPQSARFILAGGTAAGINWLSRFAFSEVMSFTAAVIVAAIIGMTVGFFTYKAFVFPGSNRHVKHQLRDFLLVNASTLVVVTAVAVVTRHELSVVLHPQMGEAAAHALGIAAGAILNYHAHRMLTFQRSESPETAPVPTS
jgi:putative flippase GtrA